MMVARNHRNNVKAIFSQQRRMRLDHSDRSERENPTRPALLGMMKRTTCSETASGRQRFASDTSENFEGKR
jgi:hypothetical protein